MSRASKKFKNLLITVVILILLFTSTRRHSPAHNEVPISKEKPSEAYQQGTVRYLPQEVITYTYEEVIGYEEIPWSKYAYVQYATNWDYLCGCVMNFKTLRYFNTKVDLVLLLLNTVNIDKATKHGELFWKNVEEANIIVKRVELLHYKSESSTWTNSFTKFHAFKLVEYDRVVYFDSDARIFNKMDELFFIPDCKIAMPSLYEANFEKYQDQNIAIPEEFEVLSKKEKRDKDKRIFEHVSTSNLANYYREIYNKLPYLTVVENFQFANHVMVIKPSIEEYNKLMKLASHKKPEEYDMDLINKLYNVEQIVARDDVPDDKYIPEVIIIPHLTYGILTGEFRYGNHDVILSDPQDLPFVVSNKLDTKGKEVYWNQWDSSTLYKYFLKLIHFSDYPIPKPWVLQGELPNDYASYKIMCAEDLDRLAEYDNYNSRQENSKTIIKPTIIDDCPLSEIWNGLYEEYAVDRKNICGLDLV